MWLSDISVEHAFSRKKKHPPITCIMYFRAKLGLAICSLLSPKLLMCFEFNCCFVHDSASCQNSVATKVKRWIPLEKWEKLLSLQHITAACTSWIIRMICNRSIIYYFWGNYVNTHCSWQTVFTLICVGVPRPQFWKLHLEKGITVCDIKW